MMDIDDILANLGPSPIIPQETTDLQALTRAWVTERCAPEILPWPESLIERVLDRINAQIDLVETQTGNTDPKTNFRLIIIQTELERFKFLIRSFLRCRLAKIDLHTLHILKTPSIRSYLSIPELQYATSHQSLLGSHYHSSFLSQFSSSLQRLDDTAGGISMIEVPDLDNAVFVRALKDVDEAVLVEGTDMAFRISKGDIYVVRWSAVRELVLGGDAELI